MWNEEEPDESESWEADIVKVLAKLKLDGKFANETWVAVKLVADRLNELRGIKENDWFRFKPNGMGKHLTSLGFAEKRRVKKKGEQLVYRNVPDERLLECLRRYFPDSDLIKKLQGERG